MALQQLYTWVNTPSGEITRQSFGVALRVDHTTVSGSIHFYTCSNKQLIYFGEMTRTNNGVENGM